MSDQNPAASERRVRYQSLRGMRDILPEDAALYRMVQDVFHFIALKHGFHEIQTPVVEPAELFVRTSGESSDIVHKELYSFRDRSDNEIALRPEGTAGVARAFIEHGMASLPQPVKLFYAASMYRYERPQAGRYREHQQFGLEVFGSADPALDAQVILMAWQAYQRLGLRDVVVQVNSIGEEESRKKIRKMIVGAVEPHEGSLSDDVKRQLRENPLRILDSKDPSMQPIIDEIPPLVDQLTAEDRDHFTQVLEYVDQAGVAYELNPRLVRGLDYYTRTVFEFTTSAGTQTAIGSGGRYDRLVEHIGGSRTPAVGMGNGIDRIVDAMKLQNITRPPEPPQVFLVQLGDVAKKISFGLMDELTQHGISVTSALGKDSIRSQLKLADKQGVPLALIVGQKEAMDRSIIVRDMASGMQETLPLGKVREHLERRLPKTIVSKSKAIDA